MKPRTRRYVNQILPIGIIWLVVGWVFLLTEVAAIGESNSNADTVIVLDFQVFTFASISVFVVGLIIGMFEVVWWKGLFKSRKFFVKLLFKLLLYTGALLTIIIVLFPIAAAIELNTTLSDARVWTKFNNYMTSINFLSTGVQLSFSLFLSLFYHGISENLGHGVMVNFFRGKYHHPKKEQRIFMFLDMKSSTTIAERLGNIRYFELLSSYYDTFSNAIIDNEGEVYQYIGDEIVVSWDIKKGVRNAQCLKAFNDMRTEMNTRGANFKSEYGLIPEFKAGLHVGEVITGEIGALKKEIFFTGDVLNVTARIQGKCGDFERDLLISQDLHNLIDKEGYEFESLGDIQLKGRQEPIGLFAVLI